MKTSSHRTAITGLWMGLALTLAMTEAVQTGTWDAMRPLLGEAQTGGTLRVVWYARPDGSYYTVEKGRMDQSLADRPYFPAVLNGKAVRGELVISRSTGKKSVVIAIPVTRDGKDGSTTIHNNPDLQFIDARAQDSPTLTAAVGKMLATESGEATYVFRGATKRVLYAASPLLGWRFVVGIIVK